MFRRHRTCTGNSSSCSTIFARSRRPIADPRQPGPSSAERQAPGGVAQSTSLGEALRAVPSAAHPGGLAFRVALGATLVREFDEPEGRWITLLDPEGNEFCLH